jgi:hypothetical protein
MCSRESDPGPVFRPKTTMSKPTLAAQSYDADVSIASGCSLPAGTQNRISEEEQRKIGCRSPPLFNGDQARVARKFMNPAPAITSPWMCSRSKVD